MSSKTLPADRCGSFGQGAPRHRVPAPRVPLSRRISQCRTLTLQIDSTHAAASTVAVLGASSQSAALMNLHGTLWHVGDAYRQWLAPGRPTGSAARARAQAKKQSSMTEQVTVVRHILHHMGEQARALRTGPLRVPREIRGRHSGHSPIARWRSSQPGQNSDQVKSDFVNNNW